LAEEKAARQAAK
jgi:hypothetical protein